MNSSVVKNRSNSSCGNPVRRRFLDALRAMGGMCTARLFGAGAHFSLGRDYAQGSQRRYARYGDFQDLFTPASLFGPGPTRLSFADWAEIQNTGGGPRDHQLLV